MLTADVSRPACTYRKWLAENQPNDWSTHERQPQSKPSIWLSCRGSRGRYVRSRRSSGKLVYALVSESWKRSPFLYFDTLDDDDDVWDASYNIEYELDRSAIPMEASLDFFSLIQSRS